MPIVDHHQGEGGHEGVVHRVEVQAVVVALGEVGLGIDAVVLPLAGQGVGSASLVTLQSSSKRWLAQRLI